MIYFDNAATTIKKPQCVIDAVTSALLTLGNSGRGMHDGSLGASRLIFDTREVVSSFFNVGDPNRVIFTSNATEALNTVILGMFSPGDHIISTVSEHNSVLRPLYLVSDSVMNERKSGMADSEGCDSVSIDRVSVDWVSCDAFGDIDYDSFEVLRKPNTKAVVMQHGSNLTGNIFDIERIGKWAHENGILMIVDASQTAGIIPIDMQKMNIDILCFTGHKGLMGPQGTGGICISPSMNCYIRPLKVGGTGVQTYSLSQPEQYPTHLEAGTLNAHGIAGLKAGIEFINSIGLENIYKHEFSLYSEFMTQVSQIHGIKIYGKHEAYGEFAEHTSNEVNCRSDGYREMHLPIVTLNYREMPSGEFGDCLFDEYGIATRSGAHCTPRLHEALGTMEQGAVRFSFGYFNTIDEVTEACEAIKKVVAVTNR